MQVQQLSLKLFVEGATAIDLGAFIPVFHAWIRDHRLGERLLIDVADYRHVHDGPGVMLVAHEAHYAMDREGGRLGLRVDRKRDAPGEAALRLEEAFRDTFAAALALEQESAFGKGLRFRTDRARLRIQSRLLASNTPETFEALRPTLSGLLARLYPGAGLELAPVDADPRSPFGVDFRATESPPLVTLLARLG